MPSLFPGISDGDRGEKKKKQQKTVLNNGGAGTRDIKAGLEKRKMKASSTKRGRTSDESNDPAKGGATGGSWGGVGAIGGTKRSKVQRRNEKPVRRGRARKNNRQNETSFWGQGKRPKLGHEVTWKPP